MNRRNLIVGAAGALAVAAIPTIVMASEHDIVQRQINALVGQMAPSPRKLFYNPPDDVIMTMLRNVVETGDSARGYGSLSDIYNEYLNHAYPHPNQISFQPLETNDVTTGAIMTRMYMKDNSYVPYRLGYGRSIAPVAIVRILDDNATRVHYRWTKELGDSPLHNGSRWSQNIEQT